MWLSEFVSGSAFAAALLSAGVYSPSVIQSQMTFSSNVMVTVMMGASASSAIIFEAADRLGWLAKPRRQPSTLGLFDYDGNIIGGCMVGIGMTLTKACPGTVLLQIGMGMPRAIVVAIGGVLGAFAFIKSTPAIERARVRANEGQSQNLDNTRPSDKWTKGTHMAEIMGISPFYLFISWIFICLTVIGVASTSDMTVDCIPQA